MGTTLLVVAGEASGDLHGARVLRALSKRLPDSRFVGIGGPAMEAEGLVSLHPISRLSVMGFVEVLPQLLQVMRILRDLSTWAEEERPRAALLIDASDFNLRLARELRHLGIPVVFLIAPMAWAWRASRVRALRDLDRLLCIYPFEEEWFRRRGVAASFVGNPLLEDPLLADLPSKESCRESLGLPGGPLVALLPGSRANEIRSLLPLLLETAGRIRVATEGVRFVLPIAPGGAREAVEEIMEGAGLSPILVEGRAVEVLRGADAALVCSGTATLQAALTFCPTVMVYKAHPISMGLVKRLTTIPHACIVNILQGRSVIPELIQEDFTPAAAAEALLPLLQGGGERDSMLASFHALRQELGGPGFGERVAGEILSLLAAAMPGDLPRQVAKV